MRFERVVIEAGEHAVNLDLHPRLTVIGRVGQVERDGLVGELVGALGASRSGVHLELVTDTGARFAVFRPQRGRHRVVDVDQATDVTADYRDDEGRIDLLARVGLGEREARELMRFGPSDLLTTTERDELVRSLAQVDQNELWVAAEALRQANLRLDDETAETGSTREDAALIERIEHRHADFEAAQELLERRRRMSFIISGIAGLGIVPMVLFVGLAQAVPLMAIAFLAVAASALAWWRSERARTAEAEALAEAGANSYLGFHLQRVNGLLSSDQARKRVVAAAEEQTRAAERWRRVAGDVDLTWALQHRPEITAAVRVRQDVVSMGMGAGGTGGTGGADDRADDLAHALMSRLAGLRSVRGSGESFPALLDDPFTDVEDDLQPSLLSLLVRSSVHQQLVLLTDDPGLMDWARIEATNGSLAVVDPSATRTEIDQPGLAVRA